MAVTVTAFSALAQDMLGASIQIGAVPPLLHENLANGASPVNSSVMPDNVRLVRIATDAKIRVAIGVNATAGANDMLMHANSTEYFSIRPGDRVSVVNSA